MKDVGGEFKLSPAQHKAQRIQLEVQDQMAFIHWIR